MDFQLKRSWIVQGSKCPSKVVESYRIVYPAIHLSRSLSLISNISLPPFILNKVSIYLSFEIDGAKIIEDPMADDRRSAKKRGISSYFLLWKYFSCLFLVIVRFLNGRVYWKLSTRELSRASRPVKWISHREILGLINFSASPVPYHIRIIY